MSTPVANAGSPVDVAFASLPTSVALSGASSTSGNANPVATYTWSIFSQPAGGAATLSSTNTVSTNLQNITVAGTFIVFLVVTNTDAETSEVDPYKAPNTCPTARVSINVANQHSEIVPSGLGERTTPDITPGDPGSEDHQGKTEALYASLNTLQGDFDAFTASPSFEDIYVNTIHELTPLNNVNFADNIEVDSAKGILCNNYVGTTVTMSATGTLGLTGATALGLASTNGPVTITAGVSGDSVIARGSAATADLKVDVIAEDTTDAGVEVEAVLLKDGSVQTNQITGSNIAGDVLTLDLDAEGTVTITSSESNVTVTAPGAASTIGLTANGNVNINSTTADIELTASDDITLTATDDFTMSAGTGTVGVFFDGGAQTALVQAVDGITLSAGSPAGTTAVIDGSAGTIALTAPNGVTASRLRRGFDYAITGEDTKGASTTSEVAFTNVATIPADTLAVNDVVKIMTTVIISDLGDATNVRFRNRIGGLSGLSITSDGVAFTPGVDYTWCQESSFRVTAIGASSTLHGLQALTFYSDETGSGSSVVPWSVPGMTGPATNAAIDVVTTVTFNTAHADNKATLTSLSVEIIRGS